MALFSSPRRSTWRNSAPGRRSEVKRERALRPTLDALEDRLAPAVVGTLSLTGATLEYIGTNANTVTVSGTDAAFTLSDATGTIAVNPALAAYFSGNNTGTITGRLPSTVTSVVINANPNTGVVNVPASGLTLTNRNLAITAESIDLQGNVETNSGVIGGALTLTGTITAAPAPSLNGALTIASNNPNTPTTVDRNIIINGKIFGSSTLDTLTIDAGNTTNPGTTPGNITVTGAVAMDGENPTLGEYSSFVVDGNTVALNALSVGLGDSVTGSQANVQIFAQNALTISGAIVTGAGGVSMYANQDNLGAGIFHEQ